MTNSLLSVEEFNEENFASSLSNPFLKKERISVLKPYHFQYFLSYLGKDGIGAKTIVTEYPYISKVYLTDYMTYYASCFENYGKRCKRIHFFSTEFNEEQFKDAIMDEKSKNAFIFSDESYLGHIVAKPLPDAVIGSTLLKTYDTTDGSRVFTTKKYIVNLFGKKLRYESLVYQEQDTVVSACATTAIWVSLHKASKLFQISSLTPSEITSSAGNLYFSSGRSFPSHGLDHYQIGKAIESSKIVSELRTNEKLLSDLEFIKAFLYAYNRIGIPVLIGIDYPNEGGHLIAMTGYKKADKPFSSKGSVNLQAHGIEIIYAHDDNTGPFAKMSFDDKSKENLVTSLQDPNTKKNYQAQIISLTVPIHKKIRITYEDIYAQVLRLNVVFEFIYGDPNQLQWDIFLEYSNNYKIDYNEESLDSDLKERVLFNPYPKYIWVASVLYDGTKRCDFIFDATGFQRSFFCHSLNYYDPNERTTLKSYLVLDKIGTYLSNRLHPDYVSKIKES